MLVDIFINLNEQDEVKQISTHWNFTPINDIRDFFAELDNFLNNGRIVFLFFCAIHNMMAKVTIHF